MKFSRFIIIAASAALFACGGTKDGEEVSTDLVNNPITANGENQDTSLLPKFSFTEEVHDFGVIVQGEKVSYTFKFTNTGKSDLIITSVHASCGCTVPKYDKAPVKPGKEGQIEVIFDSSGRSGIQTKTVTVLANTQPNQLELHFTAEIIIPEE